MYVLYVCVCNLRPLYVCQPKAKNNSSPASSVLLSTVPFSLLLLLLLLLLPLPHPLPLLLLIVPFSNSLHLSTSHSLSLLYPNSGVFLPQVSHRKPSVYPPAFPSASLPPD
uniref:Uncharacterized protein n=1 Tax=Cacopsylla melanoneura TaxID=428564 RepID=A0A8D8TYA1_9HEMI